MNEKVIFFREIYFKKWTSLLSSFLFIQKVRKKKYNFKLYNMIIQLNVYTNYAKNALNS